MSDLCGYCILNPPRLQDDLFEGLHFLPDPVVENGEYKAFADVHGTETDDTARPSARAQEPASERDKTLKKLLVATKVRNFAICRECGKWRVVYSPKKLSPAEGRSVMRVQEELVYACGNPLFHAGVYHNTIIVKEGINCNSLMESAYYAVTSDDENDDNPMAAENVNEHVISEHDDDIPIVESCNTLATGCDCTAMCLDPIDREAAQAHIDNIRQYTKDEKDLYIMGALNRINSYKKRSRYGDCQRTRYNYKYNEGNVVCKKTFMCVYDIGPKNLLKHVNKNGNVPRHYGNQDRRPIHALTFQEIENESFLKNVAVELGLPMPAAPREGAKDAPVFLHSYTKKMKMHNLYEKSCIEATTRCI
ncbi:uncharacterized protein LOC128230403 isoform X1 [Mya arenaria]|uniref:uncharacterized protein LOC128230403 isoform X1 n=1 Tax=Mya arenaria TaxID=6604 RepID=UPI0022E58E91|nr:uncharacterized protein LOC128230403 isoform X1 [Mya arenaria]